VKRLGFIINPIAGLGGRVGLKGTDGRAEEAMALGARPLASRKAGRALAGLQENRSCRNRSGQAQQGKTQQVKTQQVKTQQVKIQQVKTQQVEGGVQILTPPGAMGEDVARAAGFSPQVVEMCVAEKTSGSDTIAAAKKIKRLGGELILFVGGDGTARDICFALGDNFPVIGVPAGVKIHSPVFARTPEAAGELAWLFLGQDSFPVLEQEVLDIDESAYARGRVSTKLYGYLQVPDAGNQMQNRKAGTPLSQRASQNLISLSLIDAMEKDIFYLVGPGTTTRPVLSNLELDHTLLGVDVVQNRQLVKKDASERQILEIIEGHPFKIIITPIGGQGYLFGRGNLQISPRIIKLAGKENILVGATLEKIGTLRGAPFLVDTGDRKTDLLLAGYIRVVTGYRREMIYPVQ